jgi:hypothetical protein
MMRLLIVLAIVLQGIGGKGGIGGTAGIGNGSGGAGPAFVQLAPISLCNFCGTAVTVATFTTQNVTGANLIAGFVAWSDQVNTVSTITDTVCGNTYTLGTAGTGNTWSIRPFYAKNVTGAAKCEARVTLSGTANLVEVFIEEASGLNTSTPFDTSAVGGTGFQGIGNTLNCSNITTANTNEFVQCVIVDTGSNGGVMTQGAGMTSRTPNNTQNLSATIEDGVRVSSGSFTPTFTDSTASNNIVGTMAFKQ